MLSANEIQILSDAGFGQDVGQFIRSHTSKPIERTSPHAAFSGEAEKMAAISMPVSDGEEAEKLFDLIQPGLISRGHLAFWSKRHEQDGRRVGDELIVLRTDDDRDIIRYCQTDGANYDVTTADILDRLQEWRFASKFDIVGADHDFVMLKFTRLPERLCDFAAEVDAFCPDAAGQGVAVDPKFNTPTNLNAAAQLCPEVKVKPRDMPQEVLEQLGDEFLEMYLDDARKNVRLLALKLRKSKELFLWWD